MFDPSKKQQGNERDPSIVPTWVIHQQHHKSASNKIQQNPCFTTSVAAKFVAFVLKCDANWEKNTLWRPPGGALEPIFFLRVSTGYDGFSTGFLRFRKTRFLYKNPVFTVIHGFPTVIHGFSTGWYFLATKTIYLLKKWKKTAIIHQQPHKTMNWVCIITCAKPIQESLCGRKNARVYLTFDHDDISVNICTEHVGCFKIYLQIYPHSAPWPSTGPWGVVQLTQNPTMNYPGDIWNHQRQGKRSKKSKNVAKIGYILENQVFGRRTRFLPSTLTKTGFLE